MLKRYKQKITDYRLIHISKWEIEGFSHYGFLENHKLFNYKTNRFSKKVVRNYSVGFNLDGKFHTLKNLKKITHLIKRKSIDLSDRNSVIQLYKQLLKTA